MRTFLLSMVLVALLSGFIITHNAKPKKDLISEAERILQNPESVLQNAKGIYKEEEKQE